MDRSLKKKVFSFNKIFGIGLSRTGKRSVSDALNFLGIRSVYYPKGIRTKEAIYKYKPDEPLYLPVLENALAFMDTSAALAYKGLDRAYPNSRFIYTVREKLSWLSSCAFLSRWLWEYRYHFSEEDQYLDIRYDNFINKSIFDKPRFDPCYWELAYDRHHQKVMDYFSERGWALSLFDLTLGDGFRKLCEFLQLRISERAFPVANTKENMQKVFPVRWIKESTERITPYEFCSSPKRNLLYYIYPRKCPLLYYNLRLIAQYRHLFDEKIIFAGLDGTTINESELRRLLKNFGLGDSRLFIRPNIPEKGDGAYFIEMLKLIYSTDPEETSFFAHAKGVSEKRVPWMWEEAVWTVRMLKENLGDLDEIDRVLADHPCAGTFKVSNHAHEVPAPWYYAGTFFWFKHRAVFTRDDWQEPGGGRWGAEAYLGTKFSDHEAWCLKNLEGSNLYTRSTYDKFLPASYPRHITMVTTISYDVSFLDRFLEYYMSIGIHRFLVNIHAKDRGDPIIEHVRDVCSGYGISTCYTWFGPYSEKERTYIDRQAVSNFCGRDEWVLYAETYEFHEYAFDIYDVLNDCNRMNVNVIDGIILDRFPEDGRIAPTPEEGFLDECFPLAGLIRGRLFRAARKKIMAARSQYTIDFGRFRICEEPNEGEPVNPSQHTDKIIPFARSIHCFSYHTHALERARNIVSDYKEKDIKSLSFINEARSFVDFFSNKDPGININDERLDVRRWQRLNT